MIYTAQALLKEAFEQSQVRHYTAGTILYAPGEVCNEILFIKSGFLRIYYLEANGRDTTIWFSGVGETITLGGSFSSQKGSQYGMAAIDDLEVAVLTRVQFYEMLYNHEVFNDWVQQHLWEVTLFFSQRVLDFQTLTATERYLKLLQKHPKIVHKAPLGHIATYLGITLQSLSRIRAQI